jgi:hypothetical protein
VSRFRIPHTWKEQDYRDGIANALMAGSLLYKEGRYEDAAKSFLAAAQIMNGLPVIIKKTKHNKDVNKGIKKSRDDKKEKLKKEDEQRNIEKVEPESKNPFDASGE